MEEEAVLEPGREYVVLLWAGGTATPDVVLPIVSGRVASPSAPELNGRPTAEVLNILGEWSQERPE